MKVLDIMTFPLRALASLGRDSYSLFGLTSLQDERYQHIAPEVKGYCLDIGCGSNRFIKEYCGGHGVGVDVQDNPRVDKRYVQQDLTHLPFADASFDTVTFIANMNHIPKGLRDAELQESYRCLKPGGNIIVTNGNRLAELIIHNMGFLVVGLKVRFLGAEYVGDPRDDDLTVSDREIISRLCRVGFEDVSKKYFVSQWGLNHLIMAWKKHF